MAILMRPDPSCFAHLSMTDATYRLYALARLKTSASSGSLLAATTSSAVLCKQHDHQSVLD